MSSEKVMSVSKISKRYRLGVLGGATLSDDLKVWWAKKRGKPNPLITVGDKIDPSREGDHFWALRDVSFDVYRGEILGIIGKNGAGKSTLLKLLSQITGPTSGSIKIRGKVASLLEVGTGFHPELTGRENIYLNGAILGMNKAEINKRIAEIIDFSGILHHIDTPVKRYSSGMKVRLGFAVAAHLEPEILIIDEVLAVGDAEFQRKCLGKMKDISGSGRTIIFVSHNMVSVQSLCTRAILIGQGQILLDGSTDKVVHEYLKTSSEGENIVEWNSVDAPGTESVRMLGVEAIHAGTGPLTWRTPFKIEVRFNNLNVEDGDMNVGIHLYNGQDILTFASNLKELDPERRIGPSGKYNAICEVPGDLLNVGNYRVVVNFFRNGKMHCSIEKTISFEVHEEKREGSWFGRKKGVVRPLLRWDIESI